MANRATNLGDLLGAAKNRICAAMIAKMDNAAIIDMGWGI